MQLDVDEILFTQATISQSFTNGYFTVSGGIETVYKMYLKEKRKNSPFNIDKIAEILTFDAKNLELDVVWYNGRYFSCNNRRLCMLRRLKNSGLFDGMVTVNTVTSCRGQKQFHIRNDVRFTGGPTSELRGQKCLTTKMLDKYVPQTPKPKNSKPINHGGCMFIGGPAGSVLLSHEPVMMSCEPSGVESIAAGESDAADEFSNEESSNEEESNADESSSEESSCLLVDPSYDSDTPTKSIVFIHT